MKVMPLLPVAFAAALAMYAAAYFPVTLRTYFLSQGIQAITVVGLLGVPESLMDRVSILNGMFL